MNKCDECQISFGGHLYRCNNIRRQFMFRRIDSGSYGTDKCDACGYNSSICSPLCWLKPHERREILGVRCVICDKVGYHPDWCTNIRKKKINENLIKYVNQHSNVIRTFFNENGMNDIGRIITEYSKICQNPKS